MRLAIEPQVAFLHVSTMAFQAGALQDRQDLSRKIHLRPPGGGERKQGDPSWHKTTHAAGTPPFVKVLHAAPRSREPAHLLMGLAASDVFLIEPSTAMPRPTSVLITFGLLLTALCMDAQQPGATWEPLSKAEAKKAGWSPEKLAAARAHTDQLATSAVMIVVKGKVLASWGAVDQKFNAHSIRKSLISALFGLQVAAGKIRLEASLAELGIDDNAPSLTAEEKRATVHDLLKARSGVYHPALYETASMKAARPQRHSHAPGSFWYYNNWDFNALGTIYEQACGQSIHADFKRLIAEPIGMEDYQASDGTYVTGSDSIHRAYPFRMTARDLARFGLLYLRGGAWHGRQVVPADWVRDSVLSHSEAGSRGGYGYLWWTERGGLHLPGVTLPAGSYSARGAGGHYVLVIPALDLVLVHRVNTDLPRHEVSASDFGELTRLVLNAYEPPAQTPLETLLPLLMSRHRVPGAAVVRIEDHRIVSATHLGARVAGEGDRIEANTVFEVASMTKPLCAYAALKLVEQGRLDLDRPLVAYLGKPYLTDEPLHQKITARMVLTHTSGFPNWRPKGGALQVLHEPGSAYRYSGEGILMLQRALEAITGEEYEAFMQRTLLQPLGMTHSHHVWKEATADQAAAGHDAQGKPKTNRSLYQQANAAYSLYTTSGDYARFVLEMMNPDRRGAHSLSADSLRWMLTPASPPTDREPLTRQGQTGSGEVRYGLGWVIEPTLSGPRIRHSGSNGTGFRSHTEFDPATGHGLLILTNSVNGDDLWKDLIARIGRP